MIQVYYLCWSSDKFRTFYHCTYRTRANFSLFQLRLGIFAEEGDENVVEVQMECFDDPSLNRTLLLPSLKLGRIPEVRA